MWRELLFGEREVFTTFDRMLYYRAVQALRDTGVKHHTRMKYTGSSAMRGGHRCGFGENPDVQTQYQIYVKKKDYERASHVLRSR